MSEFKVGDRVVLKFFDWTSHVRVIDAIDIDSALLSDGLRYPLSILTNCDITNSHEKSS